jgi:hypothetical protein
MATASSAEEEESALRGRRSRRAMEADVAGLDSRQYLTRDHDACRPS